MENKKLIKILLKDMGELEELIGDVKTSQRFDPLEMEFIHTRARGLQQLLQLLDSGGAVHDEPVDGQQKGGEPKATAGAMAQKAAALSEAAEKMAQEEYQEKPKESPPPPDSQKSPEPPESPEPAESPGPSEPTDEETQKAYPPDTPPEEPESEEEQDEMLVEEREEKKTGSRLGESFLKGKSVNDLITDQHKLDYKLSNRPVSSIQAAIGINDRFQYIRELFGGDSEKFLEAVKTLDSMNNIHEAVEYLRTHFKWKKNETSLKFVNLVKRRFLNAGH